MVTLGQGILFGLLALLASSTVAWAETGVAIKSIQFANDNTLGTMDLGFSLSLNDSLLDALEGGITLAFIAEMKVMEKRLFLDREVHRYSWRAQLRQRSYGQGYEYHNFGNDEWRSTTSVDSALADMSNLHLEFHDAIFLRNLRSNPDLFFTHRVELVLDHLPDPLQVNLLTSSEWSFSSGWQTSQP